MLFNVVALSFFLAIPWLATCSKRLRTPKDHGSIKLTRKSLCSFTERLTSGTDDSLVTRLRGNLCADDFCQRLCLRYLIGSVVVFGQVNSKALRIIRNLCKPKHHMSKLLIKLARQNDCNTVAQFVATSVWHKHCDYSIGNLLKELIEEDWDLVSPFITKVLAVLENDPGRRGMYYFILRQLPVERQCEMIDTGSIPSILIRDVYFNMEFDPVLREAFALARCACSPSPRARERIATQVPYFKQFLPDPAIKNIELPCPATIPALCPDMWCHVFVFLDIESLVYVLPRVCNLWRKLHSRILVQDTKVHDLYCQDLVRIRVSKMSNFGPWKYWLVTETDALEYLGRCIADNVLARIGPNSSLQYEVLAYLEAVVCGVVPPPDIGRDTSPSASFLKLFEMIYEFCRSSKPSFDKPGFLTDEQYVQAIHHFVCEKGWILKLSRSWAVDNVPKLFSIVKEDEDVMKALMREQFEDLTEPSVALIMHAHTNDGVPEKLTRLFFSKTEIFKALVEPELVCHGEYYHFVVDSGILIKLAADNPQTAWLHQFLISLVLSLKGDSGRLDRTVASMASQFPRLSIWRRMDLACSLGTSLPNVLRDASKYSPDDADFVWRIMTRSGWLG